MNSLKLVLVFLVFAPISLLAQDITTKSGKDLFNNKCAACHKFDKKLVGPPLEGISQKHNVTWLRAWLKDSSEFIKSGDEHANLIYNEYNKIPCLTYLNEKDTEKILIYIDNFPKKKEVLDVSEEVKVKGKKIFNDNCAACHKLDKRLIGPPLKGITNKRDRKWLHAFIKDSPAMIASGDSIAVQVFEEYNGMPMVAYPQLSEEDIDNILAYLKEDEVKDETEKN